MKGNIRYTEPTVTVAINRLNLTSETCHQAMVRDYSHANLYCSEGSIRIELTNKPDSESYKIHRDAKGHTYYIALSTAKLRKVGCQIEMGTHEAYLFDNSIQIGDVDDDLWRIYRLKQIEQGIFRKTKPCIFVTDYQIHLSSAIARQGSFVRISKVGNTIIIKVNNTPLAGYEKIQHYKHYLSGYASKNIDFAKGRYDVEVIGNEYIVYTESVS